MEADEFFEFLFENSYTKRFDWKDKNEKTVYYKVSFICNKCKPIASHSFKIEVKNKKHYIDKTSLLNFIKKHIK